MKIIQIIHLPLLAAIAVLVGCNPSSDETSVSNAKSNPPTLEKLQADASKTAGAIQDYAHEQRADYVKAMKQTLADAKKELDEIATRAKKSSDEVRAKAEPRILELREQIRELETRLDSVKEVSASTWSNFKSGIASAYESTKSGLNEARQWVSDTIEPKETP